jgi:hypothetical protein
VRLAYAYAGFSLALAAYFLYLTAGGLRTPEVPLGAARVDLFAIAIAAYAIFTVYFVYSLTRRRT